MTTRWIDCLDRHPSDAPAVADGRERLTYGELREQGRRLATEIEARHGRGRLLLVRARSSTAFVRTLLAVMWSGNTPVPLDPELPPAALTYIQNACGTQDILEPCGPAASLVPTDAYDGTRPALVIFTSGTSGFPKGVIVTDANLRHSTGTIAAYLDYAAHPSGAVVLPLFYSYALVSQVLSLLWAGGRVYLFDEFRNPAKFAATVEAESLETFCGVPSTYQAIATFSRLRPLRMPTVRVLCSAGAAMDPTVLETIREVFPAARFFNNYGMTEASPRIAYIRDDDPRFAEPTCGRPMAGVEVKIIDPDTEEAVPENEPGMLVLKGPNVTPGYLNDPERTRKAFTRDGYLKSGDMARLDRGYIFIVGRYDDIFNCGGEKVAPLEIERALNAHPGVESSAVAGLPDPQRGMVPVAFVKLREPVARQALVTHLSAYVSKGKIPLRFYQVTSFPMTPNGKLQRSRLSPAAADYVVGEIR